MAGWIPLLCIVGPTAVGKTEVAIELATQLGGEIVSADSMQIYKRMDIGTAKPTPEQRAQARFHLIDYVAPDEPYSVQRYQREAESAIAEIHERGALPLMCGGTGLYVNAVLDHYVFPPGDGTEGIREQLQQEATQHGPEALHRRLQDIDPDTAAKTPPQNVKRVMRALEVFALTGKPMSRVASVDRSSEIEYNPLLVGTCMPRARLYQQIEARVDAMMAAGLLEEVEGLLGDGYGRHLQSMQALGYRQLAAYVAGEASLSEAVDAVKVATRRYAKRQLTWLRPDQRVNWIDLPERKCLWGAVHAILALWHEHMRRDDAARTSLRH